MYKKAGQTGGFTPRGAERRRHQRTALARALSSIAHRDSGRPVAVVVHDVSRGGVGISCQDAIRRGETFSMDVNFGNGPLKLKCRVATCRLGPDDHYIIGAEFVEIHRHTAPVSSRDTDDSGSPDAKHLQDVEARLNQLLADPDAQSASPDRRASS